MELCHHLLCAVDLVRGALVVNAVMNKIIYRVTNIVLPRPSCIFQKGFIHKEIGPFGIYDRDSDVEVVQNIS